MNSVTLKLHTSGHTGTLHTIYPIAQCIMPTIFCFSHSFFRFCLFVFIFMSYFYLSSYYSLEDFMPFIGLVTFPSVCQYKFLLEINLSLFKHVFFHLLPLSISLHLLLQRRAKATNVSPVTLQQQQQPPAAGVKSQRLKTHSSRKELMETLV